MASTTMPSWPIAEHIIRFRLLRFISFDRLKRLDAIHDRHGNIQQNQIGSVFLILGQGDFTILSFNKIGVATLLNYL